MLTFFYVEEEIFRQTAISETIEELPKEAVWIDLLNPTKEEEFLVEKFLGCPVPTRDDMQEIEASSRVHVEKGSLIMTLPVLSKSSSTAPESEAVTFILSSPRLITVRYADPMPFRAFIQRANRNASVAETGEQVLLGLLDQIADRLADILEGATSDLEHLSHEVFSGNTAPESVDFKNILREIGRVGNLATKAKDCLLNLTRLLSFLAAQLKGRRGLELKIASLNNDAISIDQHASFLSSKVGFLLDATLGMISIEQNNVIKIFSVAAAAFLPPTLIASIYGMNFRVMPELEMAWGYPLAIVLMVVSAILPLWYFRRRKWL